MAQKLVLKFGGTSLGNANAIRKAVNIIGKNRNEDTTIVVVVSAVAGITNALNLSLGFAEAGDKKKYRLAISVIKNRINKIANELLENSKDKKIFSKTLSRYARETQEALVKIQKNIGNSLQHKDLVLSFGERVQVHLLQAVLNQANIKSEGVQSSEIIITDDNFSQAAPQQPITDQSINQRINPLLDAGIVPVISGFVASNLKGEITTLGRGGSDYSAAIVAAAIQANEVWIWTDVDGILTTDPALVASAKLIDKISYEEVYDLAYFGAKVLHPNTILPLEGKGIPVRIKNTFNEENQGTFIHVPLEEHQSPITAVTGIKRVNIISLRKRRNEDLVSLIETVKQALQDSQIHVLGAFLDTAKDVVYLAVKEKIKPELLAIFEEKLTQQLPGRSFKRLHADENQTLITAVGHKIQKNPILLEKLKFRLEQAGIPLRSDEYQNTTHSLSFLVNEQDHLKAITQLHNEVLSHA
jgi:aspartate kinase